MPSKTIATSGPAVLFHAPGRTTITVFLTGADAITHARYLQARRTATHIYIGFLRNTDLTISRTLEPTNPTPPNLKRRPTPS